MGKRAALIYKNKSTGRKVFVLSRNASGFGRLVGRETLVLYLPKLEEGGIIHVMEKREFMEQYERVIF